ncbi:MAG: methylated-DNA--[protein]-cysteine S-methyltransferase [Candidatus Methanoplasma sp.]|jgi:methylated-DNA-[protein]-cysteine S-methyltransferase|nr:methylated-DNA--[protein]-cysteine S-methyltransferase [Candidatus Methanoplasma sp.]
MIYSTEYESPLGSITVASDGSNTVGLWIEGQKYYGGVYGEKMEKCSNSPIFSDAEKWLDKYFSGENPRICDLPLAPEGGEFRQTVWKILCEIPYGQTVTYGDIAKRVSKDAGVTAMSARAVGGAVGHNPISIIIPCHRVVGADGSLTGYSGGIDAKMRLLEHEGTDMSGLHL